MLKEKKITLLIATIALFLWSSPQDASCGELYRLIPLRNPLHKGAESIKSYELAIGNAVIYKYNATMYFVTQVINRSSSCELKGEQVMDWASIKITTITAPLIIEKVNAKKIVIELSITTRFTTPVTPEDLIGDGYLSKQNTFTLTTKDFKLKRYRKPQKKKR